MANNPKKVKDPTEVALSAIQEALNISDVSAADNERSSVRSDVTPAEFTFDLGLRRERVRHPPERRPVDVRTDRGAAPDPPRRQ